MRNKIKFALLALFLAVVLVGPVGAATIHDSAVDVPTVTYTPFNIAYEIYNNTLGINADAVPIYIHNQAAITSAESKNLRVFNGKVNLSGQNVFLQTPGILIRAMVGTTEQADGTEPCDGGALGDATLYAIGESIAGAVPSADISINIYDIATFCTRNALGAPAATITGIRVITGTTSYVAPALGHVDATSFEKVINLTDALNFNVDPNLNPTCDVHPTVQLAYIAQTETSPVTTILVITPQFTGTKYSTALNAELDTDTDFMSFVWMSGPNFWSYWELYGPAFVVNNLQRANPPMWKAWVAETNIGGYSFQLNSVNTQPSIGVAVYDYTGSSSCAANSSSTAWTCGQSGRFISDFTAPDGYIYIDVWNPVSVEMNPTVWTISNATITISGGTVTTACFAPTGSIGVWFGGLEALVPFVKGDVANGYETYIKLFNRYTKDAKLYVATFKDGINGPMIISTTQIVGKEFIPMQSATNPNGMLQITSADIASICPTCDMVTGIPVKFLIRVPSQMGSTTFDGDGYFYDDDDDDFYVYGDVTHSNQFDPYIEGVVVSTSPAGVRTIPIEFKYFKNGEYNY